MDLPLPDKPSIYSGDVHKPTSTSLDDLAPDCRARVEAVIAALEQRGFTPRVYETFRSFERGAWLKSRGLSQTGGASRHCFRAAADIIDGRRGPDGRMVGWGASLPDVTPAHQRERAKLAAAFFAALGEEAHAAGLEWGGDWKSFPDLCHVQTPSKGGKGDAA